jgi:hypothetical protein
MTTLSFFVALITALIGFSIGRFYVYRQLRQTLVLEKEIALSDTPIGDALARELNIIINNMDAGDRA